MYLLMNLHGKLTGSVSLECDNGATAFELKLRNGAKAADGCTAYLVSETQTARTAVSSARGSAAIDGAAGFLLTDERGNALCEACSGSERVKNRLRLLKYELAQKEPQRVFVRAEKGGRADPEQHITPASGAGKAIAAAARELFSGEYGAKTGEPMAEAVRAETDAPGKTQAAVRNPFPKTLPDSRWRSGSDSGALFGEAEVNGRRYELTAERLETRRLPVTKRPKLMRGADGALYAVHFREITRPRDEQRRG